MWGLTPEVWRKKWLTRASHFTTGVKDIFRADPCSYCGGPGGTLDHIHPRPVISGHARGDHNNYTGACERCNVQKGADPHFLLFFAKMQGVDIPGYTVNPGYRSTESVS